MSHPTPGPLVSLPYLQRLNFTQVPIAKIIPLMSLPLTAQLPNSWIQSYHASVQLLNYPHDNYVGLYFSSHQVLQFADSSAFSLSSSMSTSDFQVFYKWYSLIFTPFLWNTIAMRKPAIFWEAGEEKEKHRQLFLSSVRIRVKDYCKMLGYRLNYLRSLPLHLILMPSSHSFPNMVPKSHFHQLKKYPL